MDAITDKQLEHYNALQRFFSIIRARQLQNEIASAFASTASSGISTLYSVKAIGENLDTLFQHLQTQSGTPIYRPYLPPPVSPSCPVTTCNNDPFPVHELVGLLNTGIAMTASNEFLSGQESLALIVSGGPTSFSIYVTYTPASTSNSIGSMSQSWNLLIDAREEVPMLHITEVNPYPEVLRQYMAQRLMHHLPAPMLATASGRSSLRMLLDPLQLLTPSTSL